MRVAPAALSPPRRAILTHLGMTAADPVSSRLDLLIEQAAQIFDRTASPAAVFHRVSHDEFATVYAGSGWNAPESPLEDIFPRADALALFAGTLGQQMDHAIGSLFKSGDPALGYMLDVTAASAADRLAEVTAVRFLSSLHRDSAELRVLPYSPGYCGWHVSGQRELFAHLQPDEIGIALTRGCLMDPLKSVSGVLVAGRPAVHRFRPTYPFCDACTTHECRVRMASVRA
jgi:hypothetical protein